MNTNHDVHFGLVRASTCQAIDGLLEYPPSNRTDFNPSAIYSGYLRQRALAFPRRGNPVKVKQCYLSPLTTDGASNIAQLFSLTQRLTGVGGVAVSQNSPLFTNLNNARASGHGVHFGLVVRTSVYYVIDQGSILASTHGQLRSHER